MIWTIKIKCEWGRYLEEECIRVIEIDEKTNLYELHLIIQELVNFENDHLFEFFAGRDFKNRKLLFVEKETWNVDYEETMKHYDQITLTEIYPLPKRLTLFYHFDFGDDWYFKIIKSQKKPRAPEKGIKYPQLIESVGPVPNQYPAWDE